MEWTSIEDKLPPDDNCWVLVYANGAINCMAYFKSEWRRWSCSEDDPLFNIRQEDITHWMPLPPAPHNKAIKTDREQLRDWCEYCKIPYSKCDCDIY